MCAIDPWRKRPFGHRRPCRDTDSTVGYSATKGDDGTFTITGTVTVTFVTTIGQPSPTGTTTMASNPTLGNAISTSTAHPTEQSTLPSISSSSLPFSSQSQSSPFDVLTTPTPSSTLAATEASSGTRSTIPSSAIIGIIITVVILLFIIAFFLAWQRRRRRKRQEGTEEAFRADDAPKSATRDGHPDDSRASIRPPLQSPTGKESDGSRALPTSAYVDELTTKGTTVSSGGVKGDTKTPNVSHGNMLIYTPSSGMRSPPKATVVNTFITGLPDELPVNFGQKLKILAEYDDGWVFCANEKGERGMVPTECLAVYVGKGLR